MSELAIVNMNLPARVWLPIYDFPHYVVRIPYRSAAVLNSKEKAPYIVYIEVIECDNVFTTPLTPKLLDNYLQTVKSQENLLGMIATAAAAAAAATTTSNNSTTNITNNTTNASANNGPDSETNSQINFNVLPESTVAPVTSVESSSPPKQSKPIVESPTGIAVGPTITTTIAPSVPKTTSGEGLFDQNNFDRWSISSDVGPMNAYSNGNTYYRVSYQL